MPFSLSDWFLRRKIDVEVRLSGRPVEHRRVVNPYHAVSIEPCASACAEVHEIAGRRFLATQPPMLPLAGCDSNVCKCRYLHHSDRRLQRDRRVKLIGARARGMADRRSGSGRRLND